eukprot:4522925-Amphidinium_carterae.1
MLLLILRWLGGRSLGSKRLVVIACAISDYPFTLHDLTDWCVEHLVAPALHYSTSAAILWAGEPGVGKTPVANAVSNVLSQWHKNMEENPTGPTFKSASDLDMYRGELSSRCCPYVYDDGASGHPEALTLDS